jgi:hypothetical protein
MFSIKKNLKSQDRLREIQSKKQLKKGIFPKRNIMLNNTKKESNIISNLMDNQATQVENEDEEY